MRAKLVCMAQCLYKTRKKAVPKLGKLLQTSVTDVTYLCIGWHSSVPPCACRLPAPVEQRGGLGLRRQAGLRARQPCRFCTGGRVTARRWRCRSGVGFSVGANTGIRQVVLQVCVMLHCWPSNELIISVTVIAS